MALGHLCSLSRRVLSRCRVSATTSLLLRPVGHGTSGGSFGASSGGSFGGTSGGSFGRSFSSFKRNDVIEMTGPNGQLGSVDWTNRPDVFGVIVKGPKVSPRGGVNRLF